MSTLSTPSQQGYHVQTIVLVCVLKILSTEILVHGIICFIFNAISQRPMDI